MAELVAIQYADPAAALAAAWKRGDREFLAVRGFSTEIVGVDGPEYEVVVYDQGVRVINGTTDTPSDARHSKLIQGARAYAGRYNRLLLQRLGRGGHVEPSAASPEPGTPHPAPPAEGE
jgi:hypothetical protein